MDPLAEYAGRRAQHQAGIELLERRHRRVALLRAASFLAAIGLAFVDARIALAALVCFVFAALWHSRIDVATARARVLVAWYERALRRCAGAADSSAPTGSDWFDADHPYAGELDVLGPASLFASLCHATTGPGQAKLAQWLLAAASPEIIRARQLCVAELAPQLNERETMLLAAPARASSPRALARWAELSASPSLGRDRLAVLLLSLSLLASLGLWLAGPTPLWPFVAVAMLALWVARRLQARLSPLLAPLDELASELRSYAALFELLEAADYQSPHLRELKARALAGGHGASARARELSRLRDALDLPRNVFFAPLAALLLWRVQIGLALELWRSRHAARLLDAVDALAELEALHSLARDAFEHPKHAVPVVDAALGQLVARELAHPLLPAAVAVANDLVLGDAIRLYVVSGSNMSGKSTWLRSIGVNSILAQCGGRVRAASWQMPPLSIAASLRASDSLVAGESRFAAELHRLRIVLARAQRGERLLFLLDELFHGTHSHDRRAGARAFVGRLLAMGHVGLFTTHDLALTELDGDLAGIAVNVHFRDEVVGESAHFDYRVHPGVVTHSNALRLMRAQGLID